jgi:hypothetical protein
MSNEEIRIRNISPEEHAEIKALASQRGLSITKFALAAIRVQTVTAPRLEAAKKAGKA